MKKTSRRINALLVALVMMFSLTTIASAADERNKETSLRARYVEKFINYIEGTTITTTDVISLQDISDNQIIAVCYTLSTGGYAIIDAKTNLIYEYSVEATNPYKGQNAPYYYAGPFNYFVKKTSGVFVHTRDNGISANNESIASSTSEFTDYRESIRNVDSLGKKITELETRSENSKMAYTSGYLTSSLSTLWLNGYCGPTAAHCVLKYEGKLRSDAYNSTAEIQLISTYTGVGVNLYTLMYGIQDYLDAYNISATSVSSPYNWSLIENRITANKPLTLGTSGGGLAEGGHVQTIHGYFNSGNDYLLYVNDGWGNNYISIVYNTTNNGVPSYLKDHVYVY